MKQDEVLSIFKETGALLDGHFRLSSGLHSNQYFQCAKVLQYPRHGGALCEEIAGAFSDTPIDLVIAPALGGIVVGQEVGRQLDRRTIFAERKGGRWNCVGVSPYVPGSRSWCAKTWLPQVGLFWRCLRS
jgi:orotate phosphoribosyltransferase